MISCKHKAAQVRKHPPSFVGSGLFFAAVGVITGSAFALAMGLAYSEPIDYGELIIASLLVSNACIFFSFIAGLTISETFGITFYGRAAWVERSMAGAELASLPSDIYRVVHLCNLTKPRHASFVIGELKREERVLDPYIVLECDDGDRICLGIWEDDTVIACATVH